MATTEIEKAEKTSLERFNFLKTTKTKLITTLQSIKVVDETSSAIATQQLSNAKGFTSEIEALRVIIKKPYLDTCKNIDAAAKDLAEDVTKQMGILGADLLAWKQIQAEKAEIELAAAQAIQKKIIEYQSAALVAITKCETVKQLGEVFKEYVLEFPADEVWGKFLEDANAMKEIIKKHGKLKKDQIIELENTPIENLSSVEAKQEIQTAEVVITQSSPDFTAVNTAIASASSVKTTGIRKDWKSKVLNIAELPLSFMIVDEAKVNEYMRAQVKSGRFAPGTTYREFGCEFKQEESLSIRA